MPMKKLLENGQVFAAIAILPCNNGEIRTLNFPE